MSEWRKRELGELVAAAGGYVRTGPFGSQLHAHEYTDDPFGIPVVMPKDMVHGRVDRRSVSRVDHQTAERLKAHRLAAGDIVLARRGDVGRFAAVADDEVGWLCGTGSMRVHAPDHEVLCSGFLRHAMSHPDVGEWLAGQAVGATMPNLNAEIVSRLPLSVPLVATQRRIAAFLSAFDELIEINERRIELLEDLAQSLYREWFVRFRFPGHEDVESMDSELGPIPARWQARRVGDVVSTLTRGISPKYSEEGAWIVLNQRCIRDQRVTMALARRQERVVPDAKEVRFADVLVNSTGVGTLGRTAVFLEDRPGITVDSHVTIVRAASLEAQPWLGLHMLGREPELQTMGVGSTGQTELGRQVIADLKLAVPTDETLSAFAHVAWPLLVSVPALLQRTEALAATRDLLVPRLVTGRLDISDVDLGNLLPFEGE